MATKWFILLFAVFAFAASLPSSSSSSKETTSSSSSLKNSSKATCCSTSSPVTFETTGKTQTCEKQFKSVAKLLLGSRQRLDQHHFSHLYQHQHLWKRHIHEPEHTSYLSFCLHEQNFWIIKFTPKKRVNYDKYTENCQYFALLRQNTQ